MPSRRTVYGLCSSADGVIRYIGSTTRPLAVRLSQHKSASDDTDAPVARWLRDKCCGGRLAQIVPLIERARVADERAEISRRVAAGEPLLNVRDGGPCRDTLRAAGSIKAEAEHHESVGGVAAPAWANKLETGDGWRRLPSSWSVFANALRPIRPREPLHPHFNREPRCDASPACVRRVPLEGRPSSGRTQ